MRKRLVSVMMDEFYPFDQLPMVTDCVVANFPDSIKENDILVVWGGGDISPTLYNKKLYRGGYAHKEVGGRDKIEWDMMQRAKELKVPIIGVCRGAQMLCALAGGFLIQDVTGHTGSAHKVITVDGTEFDTNTIHHQMLYPFDVPHEMLAWMPQKRSRWYRDEDIYIDVKVEPEFVYFPEVKGFAVQWHPEMMQSSSPATQYVFDKIKKELGYVEASETY